MVHAVTLEAGRATSYRNRWITTDAAGPAARRRADIRPATCRRRSRCRQPHHVRHFHSRLQRWGTRLRARHRTRHHPARRPCRRPPETRRRPQGRPTHRRAPPPHLRLAPAPAARRSFSRCPDADDPVDRRPAEQDPTARTHPRRRRARGPRFRRRSRESRRRHQADLVRDRHGGTPDRVRVRARGQRRRVRHRAVPRPVDVGSSGVNGRVRGVGRDAPHVRDQQQVAARFTATLPLDCQLWRGAQARPVHRRASLALLHRGPHPGRPRLRR